MFSCIAENFKFKKTLIITTSAGHIRSITESCKRICDIAFSSHNDDDSLMTHAELMESRAEAARIDKTAKLNAGRTILEISQSNYNSGDFEFVEDAFSVCEDEDDSADDDYNMENATSSSSSRPHGKEKLVTITKKADKVRISSAMDSVPATKGKAKKSRQGPNSILAQPFTIPLNVQGASSSNSTNSSTTSGTTSCGVSYSLQSLQELAMQSEENIRLLMLPPNTANTPVAADVVVQAAVVAPPKKTLGEKIAETAELYELGVIDDDEYKTRRKLILSSLDD